MTLGPAKPIKAPGSAILISPNIPKLAEIPPKVGSVNKEMNGNLASLNWDNLPLVFANCIKLKALSIIRAPPLLLITKNGCLCCIQ